MATHDADVERRLENWVRWRLGDARCGLGFPRASSFTRAGMPRERYSGDAVPVLAGEAQDTDRAIGQMKPVHSQILEWHYLRASLATMDELAKIVGCSRGTVAARLKAAKAALVDLLAAMRIARQRTAARPQQSAAGAPKSAD